MSIEKRALPRKPIRTNALLSVPGSSLMTVRTIDVSVGGVCLAMQAQLSIGQKCNITFELVKGGKKGRVTAQTKVIYCILNSQDGFKTGLQFLEIDPPSVGVIAEYMRD
jgi:hypothetical protein